MADCLESMVARDVVMKLFPQLLDIVDPRLISGLKQYFELGIMFQPGLRQVRFMDDVIIGDENDFSGAAVSTLEMFQEVQEQVCILA